MKVIRFKADYRNIPVKDRFEEIEPKNFISKEPSVTDKESFEIQIASQSATVQSANSTLDSSKFSIKPGEEYNPKFDFSYINRPDITFVDLEDYIKTLEERLKVSDELTTRDIENQILQAKAKMDEMSNSDEKSNNVKE